MASITIVYGSTTGNTESVAQQLASLFEGHEVETIDVADASKGTFEQADLLILGTSTWGCGDIQDDWDPMVSELEGANLAGKNVALFGLGDSGSYPDTFVDGMGILYDAAVAAGATVIGQTSNDGYGHSDSRADVDGQFVGLALDDDAADLTDTRVSEWAAALAATL